MKFVLGTTACLMALNVMGQATPDTICTMNWAHPGYRSFSETYPTTDGLGETITREYILHVPSGYDAAVPHPLVIVYHGFGDCAADWADAVGDYIGFNILADEEGFIVAYPQAAYRPSKDATYWEPGDNGSEHLYDNDVYFTQALIGDISADHNVAADQVYLAGYSNGGMMAYSVGCTRGDMVAAIGVMSGPMLDEAGDCDPAHPVPVIIFHGVGDWVLPYDGNEWYASVADVVDLWLDHNGIPASSQVSTELNAGNVVHDAYAGGNDGTCLSLYTVEQEFGAPGDHVWFSQEMDGVSPSRILWEFFNDGCAVVSNVAGEELPSSLTVSPNPFQDALRLQGGKGEALAFRLANLEGQVIQSGILRDGMTLEGLSHLPAGIYLLHAGNRVFRVVK